MPPDSVLEFDEVSKVFARTAGLKALWGGRGAVVRAVDRVTLRLGRGEVLGVVGESGSGKSTLANIILGLEAPSGGVMRFEGASAAGLGRRELRAFRRRVQMVFQDPHGSLNPRFSVGRTVEEPLIIHGLGDAAERRKRVLATLEEAELRPAEGFVDRFPHELSGGQRQRVAIARAIVLEPSLLIADEPVSMLDVSVRAGILRLLRRLVRDRQMSLVFITHDLSLIGTMCDAVAIMYRGRLVESGPALEVMRAPRHPYTRQLIAAVPVPDPDWVPPPLSLRSASEESAASGCRFAPRCPEAVARCRSEDPDLCSLGGEHRAACHLLDATPLSRRKDGLP